MSISNAKRHAQRAKTRIDPSEKLDEIVKALLEIVKALDDMDTDISRLKRQS